MLKTISLALFLLSITVFGLFGPPARAEAQNPPGGKKVAADNAQMQKSSPNIATRVLEGGT